MAAKRALVAAACIFAAVMGDVVYLNVKDGVEGKEYKLQAVEAAWSPDLDDMGGGWFGVKEAPMANRWGCNVMGSGYDGKMVVVMRGNCSFAEKMHNVAQAGGAAMIMISRNDSSIFPMGGDMPEGWKTINSVMVRYIDYDEFVHPMVEPIAQLEEMERGYTAMIVLWAMAVFTVTAGSLWASPKLGQRMPSPEAAQDPENPTVFVSEVAAMGFVVMASLVLVLLFFFMKKLIIVIIVMFCVGSISAMYKCQYDLITYLCPLRGGSCLARSFFIPCFGDCDVLSILITTLCAGVSTCFFVFRHQRFSWVFQDIMGISMCLLFIKTFRFPNIKVSSLLLVLAFFYDIFWVFISPLLFSGKSVMVTVATGGDSGEAIPMLLKFPNPCEGCGPGLLGLGDIVLPGLLVSFTRAFDQCKGSRLLHGYFIYNLIGYGTGLIITYAALLLMGKGQPALLYLVPCTLGTTLLLGCARGDLSHLWTGKFKDHKPDGSVLLNETGGSSSSDSSAPTPRENP